MTELPDDIRVPLHSLQADMDYLFGRVAGDGSCAPAMAESVKALLTQIEEALTRRSSAGVVKVTDEMVERAARAMEPMAFRGEFTATDEWFELEQEGRVQALGRARAALTAALSPQEPVTGEAVAWVTADILAAMKRGERVVPGWKRSDDFCIPLYTHPKEAEVTDSDLLAAMKKHVGWELDWGPEDRHDEESDFGWRVFERSGGRSDLEWTLLGFGESPRAALVAALSRKG